MKEIVSSLFIVLICLTSLVRIQAVTCRKDAGYCRVYSSYLYCYIEANDTQGIKTLLRDCSAGTATTLYLYKYYVSNAFGNLIVNIELPSNIQRLYLYNYEDNDNFRLTTSTQNTGLTRIVSYAHVELESYNFFNYFRGLGYVYMNYISVRELPSFTSLQYLTYLRASIQIVSPQALDGTMLSGLTNLTRLDLSNSNFNGINQGTFGSLIQLTRLILNYNEIRYIEDGALSQLSNLKQLHLNSNGIETVSNDVFKSLTQLTILDLGRNPEFPIETLLHTRYLQRLYIQYNEYITLDPFVFQQMKELRYLYLSNPFICDCRLQWTSIAQQYGLYVGNGYCSEPFNVINKPINTKLLYTNCTQTQSYQCFNKTITCGSNEVCHDTKDSYFCGCPRGYSLYSSGQCKDIDECDEKTECQHSCVNTEGTFHCACNEGYRLTDNGYDCEDINECQEWNGGCEFGCRNTIGSYQCYCEAGHELYNDSHCKNEIQCESVGRGYSQVAETSELENVVNCKGGFNLSITNLTCHNEAINTTESTKQTVIASQVISEWTGSTILLMMIPFIVVGVQTIIIIVLLVYILRKIKSLKKSHGPQNNENKVTQCRSVYQNFDECLELESPTKPSKSQLETQGNEYGMSSNETYYEPYPESMHEVVYMHMK